MFQKLDAPGALTLSELFDAYLENHAKPHCKSWKELVRRYKYLQSLANKPVESIKRFDVTKLHADIGQNSGKTAANNAIQLLKSIYNKGIEWELISCSNPAAGVKLFKLVSRERFLARSELAAFAEAVETLRYQTTKDFLWMCLFTGARRSNVAAMRWESINFEDQTWFIKETKNGTSQLLPLIEPAIALLEQRKKTTTSEWVFPSTRSSTGHLTKPEKAWRHILLRANLKNARIHDLRRSLASYMAITGANISVIAKTLNHKDLKSTQIYARLQLDPVRLAMETATREMLRMTSKEQTE